jgi:hypothetical protein
MADEDKEICDDMNGYHLFDYVCMKAFLNNFAQGEKTEHIDHYFRALQAAGYGDTIDEITASFDRHFAGCPKCNSAQEKIYHGACKLQKILYTNSHATKDISTN